LSGNMGKTTSPPLGLTLTDDIKVVPLGLKMVTQLQPYVTPLIPRLTCCPAVPSKTTSPILLAALIVTGWLLSPIAIRPVNSTSAAVKGGGGIKKSALLAVLPLGVATLIRPDVPGGTLVAIVVAVEELTPDRVILKTRLLFMGVVSKFVPVMVTAVPEVPMVGVKLVIVGAPVAPVTVKATALVAVLVPTVTLIGPVVAAEGTVATISVWVAEVTAAVTPLNLTVLLVGVVEKPVPKMVTVVPSGPLFGVNSIIETSDEI
jgi:hypothetical protein